MKEDKKLLCAQILNVSLFNLIEHLYFVLVFQVDVDDLVDEPLSGELEVVALHGHQVEAAGLVQGLQPDPVLGVDGGLLQLEFSNLNVLHRYKQ